MIWANLAISPGLFLFLAAMTSFRRSVGIVGALIAGAFKLTFVLLAGALSMLLIFTRLASRDGGNAPVAGLRFDI